MKKVIMFVIVALCAVVVQAAQVDWTSGTINIGGNKVGKGAVNGYLYLIAQSDYDSLDLAKNAQSIYDTYKAKTANATGVSAKTGTISMSTTAANGETQYALIIYETTATPTQFVLTKGYDTINDLGVQSNIASGNLFSSSSATSWTAVGGGGDSPTPEPTSGLLLLVGGAMLALRRRVQK